MQAWSDKGPVIVMGMHRSGTTVVIHALEQLGLFAGDDQNVYGEAEFFFELNEWMFAEAGASWERPTPVRLLLEDGDARETIQQHVQHVVRSRKVAPYLGRKKFRRYRYLERLPLPWGWKDPRNTFTLPVWLSLFPGARVIHVLRNGVDVAKSLLARRERVLEDIRRRRPRLAPIGSRSRTLRGGFSMWEEYVREARAQLESLNTPRMEIRYETLLEKPVESLEALALFCGLPIPRQEIGAIVDQLRRDRAYAFKADPTIASFAKAMADGLKEYGY